VAFAARDLVGKRHPHSHRQGRREPVGGQPRGGYTGGDETGDNGQAARHQAPQCGTRGDRVRLPGPHPERVGSGQADEAEGDQGEHNGPTADTQEAGTENPAAGVRRSLTARRVIRGAGVHRHRGCVGRGRADRGRAGRNSRGGGGERAGADRRAVGAGGTREHSQRGTGQGLGGRVDDLQASGRGGANLRGVAPAQLTLPAVRRSGVVLDAAGAEDRDGNLRVAAQGHELHRPPECVRVDDRNAAGDVGDRGRHPSHHPGLGRHGPRLAVR